MFLSRGLKLRVVLAVCLLTLMRLPASGAVPMMPDIQGTQVVYSNDFEGPVGSEWSHTLRHQTPIGARGFLGHFGNDLVSLTLSDLPSHTGIAVSFELFIIRTWDGNETNWQGGDPVGPDVWECSVDGISTPLLHTTFTNWDRLGFRQAYPAHYPGGDYSARTSAAENNTLGYSVPSSDEAQDAVYQLNFTFLHSDDSLVLDFSASGLQPAPDETWGIDNIVVAVGDSVQPDRPFFEDDFGGDAIDDTKWNTNIITAGKRWCSTTAENHWKDPGNWRNVETEACHSLTQASPYGTVTISEGQASFSAGQIRSFPYIWSGPPSRSSPFLSLGDFVLEVRMRYNSIHWSGAGVRTFFWPTSEPSGDNPPNGQSLFRIWGDTNLGLSANILGKEVSISDPLAYHNYRLEYVGGKYSLFVDGTLRAGPTASTLRPNVISIGNPVFTHWGIYEWSDFAVDYVRVRLTIDRSVYLPLVARRR